MSPKRRPWLILTSLSFVNILRDYCISTKLTFELSRNYQYSNAVLDWDKEDLYRELYFQQKEEFEIN